MCFLVCVPRGCTEKVKLAFLVLLFLDLQQQRKCVERGSGAGRGKGAVGRGSRRCGIRSAAASPRPSQPPPWLPAPGEAGLMKRHSLGLAVLQGVGVAGARRGGGGRRRGGGGGGGGGGRRLPRQALGKGALRLLARPRLEDARQAAQGGVDLALGGLDRGCCCCCCCCCNRVLLRGEAIVGGACDAATTAAAAAAADVDGTTTGREDASSVSLPGRPRGLHARLSDSICVSCRHATHPWFAGTLFRPLEGGEIWPSSETLSMIRRCRNYRSRLTRLRYPVSISRKNERTQPKDC